jgi:hypothetical protein
MLAFRRGHHEQRRHPARPHAHKDTITITAYGARIVGPSAASGSYVDFAAGMKPMPLTITNGTLDLARVADR